MRNRLRLMKQTYGFSHRTVSRSKSADSGCSFLFESSRYILRTNCVQPVRELMDKWWVQLPQVHHFLWTNNALRIDLSPLAQVFRFLTNQLPTTLFAGQKAEYTDHNRPFSTFSTPPITTTITYI